jgi:tRNA nucleotidyltransferase/poly(A) polymerase
VEITTLRRDVSTDGRHAEVAFTDNWQEDAARRDFTINALSCDRDGTVYDYFDGIADLNARRVRFIGEPSARIKEDYLRILRFFRFSARYAEELDEAALKAIRAHRQGIAQLSGERILSEVLKLLERSRAAAMWQAMAETGIAAKIVGADNDSERLSRLIKLENYTSSLRASGEAIHSAGMDCHGACAPRNDGRDAFRRLMILIPAGSVDKIARRLKFSGAQRKRSKALPVNEICRTNLHEGRFAHALYGSNPQTIIDQAFIDTVDGLMPEKILSDLLGFAATWKAPVFPLGGDNLMELGLKPGPIFGALLKEVEQWWIGQDFQPTRQQCFAELKRIWFERKESSLPGA